MKHIYFYFCNRICLLYWLYELVNPIFKQNRIAELNDPGGFPPDLGSFDGYVNLLVENHGSPEIVKGLTMKKSHLFVDDFLAKEGSSLSGINIIPDEARPENLMYDPMTLDKGKMLEILRETE